MTMKVRATQDGHYGGYYRLGPHEEADGTITPGDVFEIDATPHALNDEHGRPQLELDLDGKPIPVLDKKGEPKIDSEGKKIFKIKMATAFSPEWMEPVNEDATITYPDQERPLGVLPQMQAKSMNRPTNIAARPVNLPADIAAVLDGKAKTESVI